MNVNIPVKNALFCVACAALVYTTFHIGKLSKSYRRVNSQALASSERIAELESEAKERDRKRIEREENERVKQEELDSKLRKIAEEYEREMQRLEREKEERELQMIRERVERYNNKYNNRFDEE